MIGKMIRHMRVSSGFTQKELAEQMLSDSARSTISGYENDSSEPNYCIVKEIADLCDFEIHFIDKNSGEEFTVDDNGQVVCLNAGKRFM